MTKPHSAKSATSAKPAKLPILLLSCALALPWLPAAFLHAQSTINISTYVTSDSTTLLLGTDIPYTPGAGDTWNISGPYTTGTIDLGSTGASLANIFVNGSQSFGIIGTTGITSTGTLILGMNPTGIAAFTRTLDFTGLGSAANTFAGGVALYSGALRISSTAQLGTPLSKLSFLGTTGTLQIATGANLVFDSGGAASATPLHRLNVTTGNTASFLLATGATLTFSGNNITGTGAAINVATGASLILAAADPSSQYIFRDNKAATGQGAAIAGVSSTIIITNALFKSNTNTNNANTASTLYNYGATSLTTLNNVIFRDNASSGGASANGGAIGASTGNRLTITNALFQNNWASNNGGAISSGTGVTLTITSATFQSNYAAGANGGGALFSNAADVTYNLIDVRFDGNYTTAANARAGGGAIFTNLLATISATNVLFITNTTNNAGGAVNINGPSSVASFFSATFQGNIARGATNADGGGAFYTNANNAVVSFTNARFADNRATTGAGGAIGTFNTNSLSLSLNNVLFTSNTAATNGGAINLLYNTTAINATLTNVSFLDNTAINGAGGALHTVGGTLTYTVTTTATIAGNTASGSSSGLYFSNTGNHTLTLDIAGNATLDMLDPMGAKIGSGLTLSINKTGAGLWNLGGNNTLASAAATGTVNLTITTGTLHLIGAGKTTYNALPVAPGSINITTPTGAFTLRSGATLSAGGGNTISAPTITLENNSTLALDLTGALANNSAYSILTLNAPALATTNWNQYLNLLNVGSLTLTDGATYNLITLGNGNLFTTANLTSFLGITGLTAGSGYTLQLAGGGATSNILQLLYTTPILTGNQVLTWNGLTDTSWASVNGPNWTTGLTTTATFNAYDIINLASPTAPAGATALTVDVIGGANPSGMYVSGTENYTITGGVITTATGLGTLSGSAAATGKLILGASAAPDASLVTTATYTGTLTLANTLNNFTAGILINTGALVGNDKTLGAGTAGIDIAAPGTLIFDQAAATGTYAAPIRGNGSLVKTGTADLTLTGNSAAYAGTTNINAGALFLTSAAALGGAIRVNPTGTFGGSGTATGNVTVNSGGALQVGRTTATQNLAILGDLALNTATLDFLNLANQLLVGGAITQTGTSTINLNATTLVSGSYSLINVAGGLATFNTSLLNVSNNSTLLAPSLYSFSTDTNLLWLTIDLSALSNKVLTWTGNAGDRLWLGSANWTPSTAATPVTFVQGDIVNMGATLATPATSATIQLATTATVAAMYASGSVTIAIVSTTPAAAIIADPAAGQLSGSAAATGKLVLGKLATTSGTAPDLAPFTGTLDLTGITGTNIFKNGIELYSGALRVSSTDQLGTTLSKLSFLGTPAGGATTTGTLQIATGANLVFDSGGASTNRLTLAANTTGAILLENSATLTFSNNAFAGTGGALLLNPGALLTLTAGTDAQYRFTDNSTIGAAGSDGGAIAVTTATLNLIGTSVNSFIFDGNKIAGTNTNRRGAAIAVNAGLLTIDGATFRNNYNPSTGGAIAALTGARVTLSNVLFLSNTAAGTSGNGGGGFFLNGSTLLMTGGTFMSNYSAVFGGGLSVSATAGAFNLVNVSFLDNTAVTNGGAIYLSQNDSSGTITVTDGNTAQFAGNVMGSARSPNSIYISNNNNISLTINTGAGASLDMLDPLYDNIAASNTHTITKLGPGTWNLGGTSTFVGTASAAVTNFTVAEGTLRLYRAGQTSYNSTPVAAGNIILSDTRATLNFTVNPGANLHAGGGNTITASAINLAASSTITLDLFGAQPNTTSLLTLNANTNGILNTNWNQYLNLLNLDTLSTATSNVTYNLITLGNGNFFTTANLANFLGLSSLSAGYILQLSSGSNILQLLYTTPGLVTNHVLTWNGLIGTSWAGANWTTGVTTTATFTNNDIINLASPTAPAGTTALNVDTANTTVSGMYVSGNENYTVTGGAITAAASLGTLSGAAAATGKLILGASAAPEAGGASLDTTTPYTGTLTLDNSTNTFAGGILINSGVLVGNDKTLGVGAGGTTSVSSAGTLIFDQAVTGSYTAPITGAPGATLVKTNTATLTLTANNASYAGLTRVNTGALLLTTAASLGGTTTVSSSARFGGSGTAGSVLLAPNSTLQVGRTTATQNLTILGNLTLDTATLDYLTLGNQLLVGGAITQTGISTINLNVPVLSTGSYSIINDLGGLTGFNTALLNVSFNTAPLNPSDYSFNIDNNLLWLTLLDLSAYTNKVLTWTGDAGDRLWLGSANWTPSTAATPTPFLQGDIINVGASLATPATSATIQLATTATVAAMYASGTVTIAIAGAGSLIADPAAGQFAGSPAATGKLILGKLATTATAAPDLAPFTGTLDLTGMAGGTGSNNFKNGVEIYSGALRISTAAQLGATLSKLSFLGTATTTTGTLQIATGANLAFSSALTGTENRLTLAANTTGAILLENSATLAFTNNVFSGTGAALSLNSRALLTLTAGTGAQYRFTGNSTIGTAGSDGGAIALTSATLNLIGTSVNSFIFDGNRIDGTTGNRRGGAIAVNGGALTIDGATFLNNYTSGNGGAIAALSGASLNLSRVLLTTNTAASTNGGGGLFFNSNGTLLITSATFLNNNSLSLGGGLSAFAGGAFNLVDVSFLANTAATNGGAIYMQDNNTSGTLTVTPGNTARIAGNTAASGAGVYINNNNLINLAINTASGASLDMLDPLYDNLGITNTHTIIKTGPGTWNLGGSSTFIGTATTAVTNFTVAEGTLHLYRAGDTSYNSTPVAAGNIIRSNTAATLNFTVNTGANLFAGGGNTISAATINLASSSTITLDLLGAQPNAASLLTLNANPNGIVNTTWDLYLNLLNVDTLPTLTNSSTYNLITLAGGGGGNLFTTANLANFLGLGNLTAGYTLELGNANTTLQLLYTDPSLLINHVLTWNGLAGSSWIAANWTTDLAPAATYTKYDIANLANLPAAAPAQSSTLNVDASGGAALAGLYLSGTQNYTITGGAIVTSTAFGSLSGSAAATGKLILGASAAPDASALTQATTAGGPADPAAYTGTLTLANNPNTFTNGILINTGALVGNDKTLAVGATGTTTISPAGTLIFNQAATGTYASPLAGNGALVKTGAATLTLSANNNSFAGATRVNAGALLLTSAAALGGTTSVSPAATFGGSGTAATVILAPNSTLQVGRTTATQNFTILGDLTLDTATLNYLTLSNQLLVGGNIFQTGASTINLSVPVLSTGSFSLINVTGGLASFNTALLDVHFNTTTIINPADYSFNIDNNLLWLTLLDVSAYLNKVITWTNNTGDNLWLASANWTPSTAATPTPFLQGDIVNLTDSANNPAVPPASTFTLNLNSTATVAAMNVSGTASYAITGTAGGGSIVADPAAGQFAGGTAATGKLILGKLATTATGAPVLAPFTGTLDFTQLTGTNTFKNGVEIYSGALRVSSTAQLGTTLNKLSFLGTATTTTGTLQIATGANLTFSSALTGTENRLTLAANTTGAFLLENSATLTFTNNTLAGNGAALYLNTGALLTLAAGANAQFRFTNNSVNGTADGAAIYLTGATLNLLGTSAGSFIFDGNSNLGATNRRGGAIFSVSSLLTIDGATFRNNYAANNAGAIGTLTSGTVNLANVIFTSNTAGNNGGALFINTSVTGIVTSSTFTANVAANGGALALQGGNSSFTLTDVSFLDNYASNNPAAAAGGGAIYMAGANATGTINVTPGNTAKIAGNTMGAARSPNGIFINNDSNITLAINTGAAATLDMLDPLYDLIANNQTSTITKTGAGAWNLGGSSTFKPANASPAAAVVNFTVAEGTLHLYRAGQTSYNSTPVATGNLILTDTRATLNFTLKQGATLSAGGGAGGNLIAASTITLENNSTLLLDLTGALANPTTSSVLTLNALNPAGLTTANWTQYLGLLNFDALNSSVNPGDTYNLITLANVAAGSLFTDPATFTLLDTLPTGYSLQLSPNSTILQLLYNGPAIANNVLTWTGSAGNSLWFGAPNWNANATTIPVAANFRQGDIINLVNLPAGAPAISSTLNINAPTGTATVAAIYFSGTQNYTITGNPILATSTVGSYADSYAGKGSLVLGFYANDDATACLPVPDTTGTLTLANASNNFLGGIEIHTGALVGNAATLDSGNTGITIDYGTLIFNQTTDATYASPIRGTFAADGTLIKTGPATLTLTADNAPFTGVTRVDAGKLLLATGARLAGNITVAPAATFGGSGTAATVTLSPNSTLQIGDTYSGNQTLTLSTLTLSDATTLDYLALTNQLRLTGPITQTGASTINLSTLATGSYALINDTAGLATLSTTLLTLNYMNSPFDPAIYSFRITGNNLWLTLGDVSAYANKVVTWTGAAGDHLWLASPNWSSALAPTTKFAQGDIVNLSGADSPLALQPFSLLALSSPATVTALYVSGTASYAITGSTAALTANPAVGNLANTTAATGKLILGKIATTATTAPATAPFTGTLDLTGMAAGGGANNFMNGVEIYSGALRISTADQLGTTLSKLSFLGTRLTTTGTLRVATGANVTFNGAGAGSANRLILTATTTGAFVLDDNATLTITNNAFTGTGGAISLETGARLTLTAAPGAQYRFINNAPTNDGGAIALTAASLTLAGADPSSFLFVGNRITGGSGSRRGGAIYIGDNSIVNITGATFSDNISNYNGGAIAALTNASVTLANVLFASNTCSTGGGGGLFLNTNAQGSVKNATFIGNQAGDNGGGLAALNGASFTLTDVSFLDNRAPTNGGAIYMQDNNTAGTINVTPGNTAQIAGNVMGSARSPNSIYISNNNNLSLTINTGSAASLDMLDPLYDLIANNQTTTITKNGPGVWNLGGSSTFRPNNAAPANAVVNFTIAEGTLHLYPAGDTITTPAGTTYTATTGNLILTDPRGTLNLTLKAGATLSAGGKNSITASTITFEDNTTLALNIADALPGATPILTLSATAFNTGTISTWNQTVGILNLDDLLVMDGDLFNLVTLVGTPASSLFTASSFTNLTAATGLLDGYSLITNDTGDTLQLLYTDTRALTNNVITWTGADPRNSVRASNWLNATSGTDAKYARGDIMNLAGTPAATTLNIDTAISATISAMYVSGSANYTITGNTIVADKTVGTLAGTPAATGKLTLGAIATDEAAIDPLAYTGTLTLANKSNAFLGGIDILTGVLVGNAANLATGNANLLIGTPSPVTIAAPGTLIFDQLITDTYASPFAGSGQIIKTNTAALTLTADSSAFTGTTRVATGTLLLGHGSAGVPPASEAGETPAFPSLGGTIIVSPEARFGGTGTAGTVTLAPNATLQVGTLNSDSSEATGLTLGTLNLSALSVSDGSILDYTTLTTQLHVATPVTPLATGYPIINIPSFKSGTYTLGNLGPIAPLNDVAPVTIAGETQYPDARQHARLGLADNGVDLLLIGAGDVSRGMTWSGSTNGIWALTGAEWVNSATGVFGTGDQVLFDDTALTYNVPVAPKGVTATDMFVSATTNYTFTGGAITTATGVTFSGTIQDYIAPAFTGKLYKTNTGTLALNNTGNNFTAGIDLAEGALAIGGLTHAGGHSAVSSTATLLMTGGTLTTDAMTLAPGSTLAGYGRITGHITLGAPGTSPASFNAAAAPAALAAAPAVSGGTIQAAITTGTLLISGTVDGTAGFHKTGAGTLRLSGVAALAFTGASQIDEGALRVTGVATSATVVLPGATLPIAPTGSIFVVPDMTIVANANGDTITIPGRAYSAAGSSISVASSTVVIPGYTTVTPSCTVTISGSTVVLPERVNTIPATTLVIPASTVTFSGSNALLPSSTITIASYNPASTVTKNILLNGGTLALGTGTASVTTMITTEAAANDWRGVRLIQGDNARTSAVNGTNDVVYVESGTIAYALQGGLHVAVNAGPGATAVLSNTNTFTGLLRLDSGTLQVGAVTQLGYMANNTNNKIVFNGGDLEFTAPFATTNSLLMRADGIVNIDNGLNVSIGAINKATTTPTAAITKTGPGTLTVNNAVAATTVTVAEGRWIALNTAGTPNAGGTVDVHAGAVFQFSPANIGTSTTIGDVAGQPYTTYTSSTVPARFTGDGTLEVTQNRLIFTSINTDIARINITGPDTAVIAAGAAGTGVQVVFCPTGTITVDRGSLILAAAARTGQRLGNVTLKDGATLAFMATGAVKTVTLTTISDTRTIDPRGLGFQDATLASLTSTGDATPKLWFNTNLGLGIADHLTINAPVSGTYSVGITNYGHAPARYYAAIELINAPVSPDGAFVPIKPTIEIGLYKYEVSSTTTPAGLSLLITGKDTMSNGVALINSQLAALPETFFTELDNLTQRLGDLRFDDRDEKGGLAAWTRGYGSRLDYNSKLTGTPFGQRHYGAEAGVDAKVADSAAKIYLGAYAGYGQSQRTRSPDGDGGTDSTHYGAYATAMTKTGWYLDLASKFNNFKNHFTAIDLAGARTSATYKNWAIGGSIEVGKNCESEKYGWLITPQLQLAYTTISNAAFTTDTGIMINQKPAAITRGRAGIMIGRPFETGRHGTFNIYLKAGAGRQWASGGEVTILTSTQTGRFATPIKGNTLEGGAGVNWLFTKGTQLYFDYSTTQADYYIKPWGLNLGVRHNW